MMAIADTGFVIAFGNRNDRFHGWAVEVARGLAAPALTCEAVLAEAAFHLRSVSYVLSLVEDGLLRVVFEVNAHRERLGQLAKRYPDRRPDLADLCVICLSELFPRHTVITVDEQDFRVYRRNGRERIPILCPPRSAVDNKGR